MKTREKIAEESPVAVRPEEKATSDSKDQIAAPKLRTDDSIERKAHGLFCNRTLNLRAIQAIGYDMDYTLIHYRMSEWESRAYYYLKSRLLAAGWPIEHLSFDSELVTRGLIIDKQRGNVVKANRFGYVKHAFHGTEPLGFDEKKATYRQTLVDLHEPRWVFMNTLFSISEACMYMQLVDLLDQNELPQVRAYDDLYDTVRHSLDEAHIEGRLKAEIIANPDRFVDLDAKMPAALLDQKYAGKKLLLITNSEWGFVAPMMSFVFDRYLPGDMTWSDLFDISIVAARKPDFFSVRMPTFEVIDDKGLLNTHVGLLKPGGRYVGGNAGLVEESLGLTGDQILYVGDHIFADVNVSKSINRWRTALVIRELEDEIRALEGFRSSETQLTELMMEKERLEAQFSDARVRLQRKTNGYAGSDKEAADKLEASMAKLRSRLLTLDEQIAPLAKASTRLLNERWGPLMRTGKDKSHLARQIERYADVYTSRVSNFLHQTPFVYLRAHRGSLPHDKPDEFGAYI